MTYLHYMSKVQYFVSNNESSIDFASNRLGLENMINMHPYSDNVFINLFTALLFHGNTFRW